MSISVVYALVAVALWGGCLAAPWSTGGPRKVDIKAAVNSTVCPFVTAVDYDPDRIPKRITEVRCLVEGGGGGEHLFEQHCRKLSAGGRRGHCVQLRDRALVQYRDEAGRRQSRVYHVAVGCACMLTEHAEPASYPDPD